MSKVIIRKRQRRKRRRLLLVFVLAAFLGCGMALVSALATLDNLGAHLDRYLREVVAVDFHRKSVEFSFWRGFTIHELEFDAPPGSNLPHLLRIREARLSLNYLNLLLMRNPIDDVVLEEPEVSIERSADGSYTIAHLLKPADRDVSERNPFLNLPPIEMNHLRVNTCPTSIYHLDKPLYVPRFTLQLPSRQRGRFQIECNVEHPDVRNIGIWGHGDTLRQEFHGEVRVLLLNITEGLRDRLPRPAQELWDRLRPSGLVSATFSFDLLGETVQDWRLELRVLEGNLELSRFHLPVRSLGGVLEITRDAIRSRDGLEGYVLRAPARLRGEIKLENGEPKSADMSLELRELPVAHESRQLLDDFHGAQRFWDLFSPAGIVAATVQAKGEFVRNAAGELELPAEAYAVHAELHDAAIVYEHFKYPLDSIDGSVDVRDGQLEVRGEGRASGAEVEFAGSAELRQNGALDLSIAAYDVPVDERIANALPSVLEPIFDDYGLQGVGNAMIRVTHPGGEHSMPTIAVRIEGEQKEGKGLSVTCSAFRYQIDDVSGLVDVHVDPNQHSTSIVFSDLRGRHRGKRPGTDSEVTMRRGTIEMRAGESPRVDMQIHAPNLVIDGDLLHSFPQRTREMVNSFGLEGSVETTVRLLSGPPPPDQPPRRQPLGIDIDVKPRPGFQIAYEPLPYPIRVKEGSIHLDITNEIYQFRRLKSDGEVGPIITLNGDFGGDPDPERRGSGFKVLTLNLSIEPSEKFEGLPLASADLRKNLPEDLKNLVERLQVGGSMTANTIGIIFRYKPGIYGEVTQSSVSYLADIVLLDCSVNFGIQISSIYGKASFQGNADPSTPHRFLASAEVEQATLNRLRAEDIVLRAAFRQPLDIVRNAQENDVSSLLDLGLTMQDIYHLVGADLSHKLQVSVDKGTLYGGAARGFILVDLGESKQYRVVLSANNADLQKGSQDLFGDANKRGIARGRVILGGRTDQADSMSGEGELHIRDSNLIEIGVDVQGEIMEALGGTVEERPVGKIDTLFVLRNDRFEVNPKLFPDTYLRIESAQLTGDTERGSLTFDGNMDFYVDTDLKLFKGWIGWLIPVPDKLSRVQIVGTLEEWSMRLAPTIGL